MKFTYGLLIAATVAAPALANIATSEFETRDVAEQQDLFGRAVVDVVNDLYSREDLSELLGRDIEEFTTRELEELMEREFELDDSLVTREMAAEIEEVQARWNPFKWIKNKFTGGGSTATPAPPAEAPVVREFVEDVEARAEAAPAPAAATKPKEPNLIEKFLNLFRNKNHPKAKEAAAAKKEGKADAAAAPPAEAAGAGEAPAAAEAPATRELLEEAIERSLDNIDDMLEREYLEGEIAARAYDEIVDLDLRDFDEDVYERELDDEVFERDFDEEVFEREFDEEVFEREFDEVVFEREFDDAEFFEREFFDDELLEREYFADELD